MLANLACFPLVHARWKAGDDQARVQALSRHVRLTGLAIPLAVAAMAIGLQLH